MKKRRSFTVERKLEITAYTEKHGYREAEREFNINEKNIRDWRKSKNLLNVIPEKKAKRGGFAHWPDLEKAVKKYAIEKREKWFKVSTIDIRLTAKKWQNMILI